MGIFGKRNKSLLGFSNKERKGLFGNIRKQAIYNIESLKIKKEFKVNYNSLSLSFTPQFALTNLIQLRNEYDNQLGKNKKTISYLNTKIDELLEREEEFDQKRTIKFLSTQLSDDENEYLKSLIKDYINTIDDFITTSFNPIIDNAVKAKSNISSYKQRHEVLEELIAEILKDDFPSQLDIPSESEIKREAEKTSGRNYDKTAPQEEIEQRVLELIKRATNKEKGYTKFIHQSGKHKGKPNKNQLKDQLIEDDLTGELESRTITRRINTVLEANDITVLP